MDIYLLNVGELIYGSAGSLFESALLKVDSVRREKALRAGTVRGKASGLGAGLLLQKAVRDRQEAAENRKGTVRDRQEVAEDRKGTVRDRQEAMGHRPTDGTEGEPALSCGRSYLSCTVSGLVSELAEPVPLTYRYGDKGKPYLENIPLYFNLSHSGDYVLCAVSGLEVGADLQKIQPVDVRKLAKRFFSEPECRTLERCENDKERQRLFFRLWTRKEAWGKLTGEGVAAALDRDMQGEDADWLEIIPPEGYAAAVCRGVSPRGTAAYTSRE